MHPTKVIYGFKIILFVVIQFVMTFYWSGATSVYIMSPKRCFVQQREEHKSLIFARFFVGWTCINSKTVIRECTEKKNSKASLHKLFP